ncbi:type III pantothenate kinase [Balneicella halophila]|uniref:Type III pantothenate kinase n=1 Tax=Balneicella halophila TaxID=1537566 RepID=A0A7L4UQ45_BALHA|nr:type III pantothenate kinase [Balneicella halophila]PVX51905.1 type III pantothenate kinase [Balneicella halophila]
MLLAIDIGNSNVVFGLFDKDKLIDMWRVHTVVNKTSDEYEAIFRTFLASRNIKIDSISRVVISSVVPSLNFAMRNMIGNLFGVDPLVIAPKIYNKLPIEIRNPYQIGSDLVANATMVSECYDGGSIVVDMGTALTCLAVDGRGKILGVTICPGLKTAMSALSQKTAQLPHVNIEAPPSVLGTNTVHAIQAGVVLGYKGLIASLVNDMKKEIGDDNLNVIATGGLSVVMYPLLKDVFTEREPDLTLKGIRIIGELVLGK